MIMSSDMGAISIGQQSGADPNVLYIETTSTIIPPSASSLLFYAKCTQASTIRFKSCEVGFEKQYRTPNYPLILNKQLDRLMYLRGVKIYGSQQKEAVKNGEPPPAYPKARQNHRSPKKYTSFSQMAKEPRADKHQAL